MVAGVLDSELPGAVPIASLPLGVPLEELGSNLLRDDTSIGPDYGRNPGAATEIKFGRQLVHSLSLLDCVQFPGQAFGAIAMAHE
jgi:hypothetical protein